MKITLLLALLASAINAFGQGKGPTFHAHSPASYSSHDTHLKLQNTDGILPAKFDFDALILARKHQSRLFLDPVQLMDSVYFWEWDTDSHGWLIDGKDIGITYDQSNNLLGYKNLIWDTISNSWKNEEQYIFSYDVNNNLTTNTSKIWNGSLWQNELKFTYTFDVNHNLTSELIQYWYGGEWQNYAREFYLYDANNNETSYIAQFWHGDWLNSYSHLSTYDVNNNQITVLYQNWYGIAWDNYYLIIRTYDADNNLTHELEQAWNGTEWMNDYLLIIDYDQTDNMTSAIFQFWDGIAWLNERRAFFTYDDRNNLIQILIQEWNSSDWNESYYYVYSYDENNNQIGSLGYQWLGFEWGLDDQYADVYDTDKFILSSVYKMYNDDGTSVAYGDSTYFYFHTVVVSVDHLASDQDNISIYPNPSNGQFNISSNSIDKIEIFSLLGERIFTSNQFKSQTNAEIDLTQYGIGIYWVLIYNGQDVSTRKMVIQ